MRIASIHPQSKTAGLSPNGSRIEVFTAGCKKARDGSPCPGCFNTGLWEGTIYPDVPVKELVDEIVGYNNPYVTIVGGEPLDQYDECLELIKALDAKKIHIVLITHFELGDIDKNYPGILRYGNVIITGDYQKDKRIFDECDIPGVKHVIGSSNQTFWVRYRSGFWNSVDYMHEDIEKFYTTRLTD